MFARLGLLISDFVFLGIRGRKLRYIVAMSLSMKYALHGVFFVLLSVMPGALYANVSAVCPPVPLITIERVGG